MDPTEELLDPGWWRSAKLLSTPLRDLVAGFDSIAALTIPYARLPRRLGGYAQEFPRWSDIADQTPQALLQRPKLGPLAVQALVEGARHAVRIRQDSLVAGKVGAEAAVTCLVAQLSDFDRAILSGQVWDLEPVAQNVVADRLGVHPISVGRNLPRARARFAELLADPVHEEVVEQAGMVRGRFGPYLPAEVVDIELRRLGIEPSSETAQVLLHVAGAYVRRGQWVESTAIARGGFALAMAAVDAVFGEQAAPATETLLRALACLGMPTGIALTFLENEVALRRFGDIWVRWTGNTTANMAEAALHVLGAPATPEAVHATIGTAGVVSVERVNAVLSLDDRFVRATRSTWGLRAWDIPEYAGIAHAVGERIDACGGQATVDDVVTDLRARYPDISESSIRSYLATLEFITNGGVVRRRTQADGWPPVPPLNTIRGTFLNGDNEVRVAMPVTSDLLRGSGQTVHPAVATASGVSPGQQRTFAGPDGQVTLSWKLASTSGVNIGSLRAHAAAVEAMTGDTLVLVLKLDDASVEVVRLGAGDVGNARLQKLLGHAVRNPVAALAAGLGCRREDVGAVLLARGDHDLAATVDNTSKALE